MEHLGSGQFGTVNKGVWQLPGGAIEVAIKTLKPGSDEMDQVKFLQEAAIMGQFKHPNVIKLYGVVTVGEPVSIQYTLMDDFEYHSVDVSFQGWSRKSLGMRLYKTTVWLLPSQRMVVLELMPHGDLKDFLIKRRPAYAQCLWLNWILKCYH